MTSYEHNSPSNSIDFKFNKVLYLDKKIKELSKRRMQNAIEQNKRVPSKVTKVIETNQDQLLYRTSNLIKGRRINSNKTSILVERGAALESLNKLQLCGNQSPR